MTASPKQIGAIHALAARAGLDDDMRRDFLERETGARSSKALSSASAARVIDKLKEIAGQSAGAKGAVAGLDAPVAKKLRALWIAAWDLGLLRDRSDRALLSFLERQTGVSHTRFLNEPGAASSAIEALKIWLARDGKVKWPGFARARDVAVDDVKRAVINAQWMRLIELGEVKPTNDEQPLNELDRYAFKITWKNGWQFFGSADYGQVQGALGRKLRGALARKEAQE